MRCRWMLRGMILLAVTGCSTLMPFQNSAPSPPAKDTVLKPAPRELPPEQVALICWNAAEEMRKSGYEREAVEQYEKVRQAEPGRPLVAWRLAVLHDRLGDNVKALAEYQRALQEDRRNPDLLNDLGYYHYQRGDWANAETRFRQALELDDRHARATVNLGLTLGHLERYADCEKCFLRVLPPAQAQCNLGVILAHHGRLEDARRAFHEACRLDPTLVQAGRFLESLDRPAPPTRTAERKPTE